MDMFTFCFNDWSLPIIEYLIEKGADPEIKTNAEQTPLHCACIAENHLIVQYLSEKGVNIFLFISHQQGHI